MKWYDDLSSNIKIEKIPHRLLKINEYVYDSIFERDGEYYLSIKCGITTYYRNHGYENFITDGFKMIYELPPEQQKEIKIDLNNIQNFLQENKTILSTIPGSDISLNADINTEYIAHRELDKSLLIKYDNYSLKDFPMEKRNYDEKIVIERLLNETDSNIGYEKDNKYYIDIKENRNYLEIIKDGKINKTLKIDGNSIELPSELGDNVSWNTEQSSNIVMKDTVEGESLKLIEIWGDTCYGKGENLYDESQILLSGKLWHNYGTINRVNSEDELYKTTPLVQIELNTSYTYSIGEDNRYCLYDQQQQYISGGITNTFSSGSAKYVRLCGKNSSYIQLSKTHDSSNIQNVGELYVDSKGRSILNKEGNKQYKIEIESHDNGNLFDGLMEEGRIDNNTGLPIPFIGNRCRSVNFTQIETNTEYYLKADCYSGETEMWIAARLYGEDFNYIKSIDNKGNSYLQFNSENAKYVKITALVSYTDIHSIILVKGTSQSSYEPTKLDKTTILLPCQLMKVGNISDKLYWDEEKNKYVIEKNIFKTSLSQLGNPDIGNYGTAKSHSWKDIDEKFNLINQQPNTIQSISKDKNQDIYLLYWAGDLRLLSDYKKINSNANSVSDITNAEYKTWFDSHNLNFSNIYIYLVKKNPTLIETTIFEQKTLKCYNNTTYISTINSLLSPVMKVKAPIIKNDQILLARENNFDSIIHLTLEPNSTQTITFFEGGLDLKLTKGIELLDDGSEFISKRPGKYASNDYIDLVAYNPSTFTIDSMDLNLTNIYIHYYRDDKSFIEKDLINFNNKSYKSNILYPIDTKYCKVAFSLDTDIDDHYKLRILRDKTKEKGFQPLTKNITNTNTYMKSFSSIIPIRNNIERLMLVSNNYSSIDEFDIVNNLNENQKKYSYEIPKILKPGEILSYTKSGKKQFAYKYNSTLYNSIVNVNYTRPYNEYHNIADNIRFILFKELGNNNGSFNNTSNPYCATESYIDISKYVGNRITLSVASLMTNSKICFYRKDKGFISQHVNASNFVTTIIPTNAHYMRGECYLKTLAGESADNKELIQKHVMVTLTNIRCDFIPYGVNYPYTLIPDSSVLPKKYKLDLHRDNKYLFVEPYKFKYIVKDLNNISTNSYNNDNKWKLELFTKGKLPATLGYATLEDIQRVPFSTTTIDTPSWSRNDVPNTILAYTKYIKASTDFTLSTQMSIDDQGTIYLNDREVIRKPYGTHTINLNLKQGYNKLVILIVNDSGNGGLTISPTITSSLTNIESVSSDADFNIIDIKNKFEIEDIFFHNIINGKILKPQENLNIRLDVDNEDKFIFSKDFVFNPDKLINGYVNANLIELEDNSRTYINRVYGGETNLTLLTIGGNICEIYFLNDYLIENNSHYILHAKYTTGNQKIKINKIPDNARYIVIVTDKENTGTKCTNIFLFPGDLERRIDTTSEYFEMFNNFNKEIAKLSYSSDITVLKNKLPDLSKLVLDTEKYSYDKTNNRFIFPIKLDKNYNNYFLQYWNDNPIRLLNIFVDSTESIESPTKQYLINHSMSNVSNKYITINSDILSNLVDNILYLSISIEKSNKLTIYEFLINNLYKLQLEKDVFTGIYEPYTEIIDHHPMYLTAGGLTLESSSSYYGIRKLEPPKNITSNSDNGLTTITWDEVVGATSYILYLDGKALETVIVPFYETMAEIKGMLTVKAKNSVNESELSEEIFIHSVPTNPYIIHIDNNYNNDQYNFRVYFRDNSDIETGYRVRYQIDNRQEVRIDLPASPGTGKIVETNFSAVSILEKVIVRITSLNEKGENELASQFILKLPPKFVWTYSEESKKIVLAWDNVFPECPEYVIRYKKKDDETATTIKIPNDYEENTRIRHSIDLEPDDEMELSLTGLKEEIYYIFTKPIKVSKALDVTKNPPDNFSSKKLTNDTIEFSWMDNSIVETGWELSYTLNNKTPKTIFIPTTSSVLTGKTYKYSYKFPETGFINTKLRMIWELGTSNFTKEIKDYYFDIDNKPPNGLKKKYLSRTTMLIEWDSQEYVESYDLTIEKNEKTEIINTKYNSYTVNLNDQVIDKYKIKVKTNFLGDQHSLYSEPLEFTPTWSDNNVSTILTTKCKNEYSDNIKTISNNKDIFEIATKSTNKASWNFLLTTTNINQFQMYDGLISTETWNTGQRTEYDNTMVVKTEDIVMHEARINVVNYQTTEYKGNVEHFIYSPSSINGKIVMEINKTRIVCIGDSITAGHPGFWAESMTGEITHQYPYWLDRRLKFQYEVINKGYGSDRTFNVLNRFQKDVLDLSPQYCLMQIGTNDIYWGASSADGSTETFENTTLSEMKSNVKAMVDLCFKNNIVPIIGMLIPRTQVVTDPVVKFGLYAFNEWIVEYANKTEGLNYVDFFNAGKDKVPPTPLEDPKSPGAMNPIYDGDNVYDEMGNLVKYGAGIHLNAAGYRIMAEAIPLNLFTSIESGVKMYMDEKCTIEAEYNTEDKQNPFYEIEIDGMKLTRTKKIVRYVKNIGNSQVLFSIYPNDLHNLDYSFKFKETDEGTKTIAGILTPGGIMAIRMDLTPLTEDSKSSIELSLVSREFSIES